METHVIMEDSFDQTPKPTLSTLPDLTKRFKFCVIENGEIRIPEEEVEHDLMNNVTQCLLKNKETAAAGCPIPESLISNSIKECLKETEHAEKVRIPEEVKDYDFNLEVDDDPVNDVRDYDFNVQIENVLDAGVKDYDFNVQIEDVPDAGVKDYDFNAQIEDIPDDDVKDYDFNVQIEDVPDDDVKDYDFNVQIEDVPEDDDGKDYDFNVQIEDVPEDDDVKDYDLIKDVPEDVTSEEKVEEEEKESVPKVEHLDTEVMNQLLDYYRKFNERQMGLTIDDDAPFYKPTKEPPVNVVCDNNIIKEAVLRVGKKIEAGEAIKEPTIIEMESDDDRDLQVGWRAVELEKEIQKQLALAVEREGEEDSVSEMDQFEEILNQLKAMEANGDDCLIGTNFIEKTLQRNIDKQNQKNSRKKWEKKDIKNLVDILSEKLGRKRNIDHNKDDLHQRLDVINFNSEDFLGDSLFERLKRGEEIYDDSLDLEDMIVENAFQYTTERVVSRHKKIYYGGDELEVVFDYVKNIFSLRWVWNVYERAVNKLLYRLKAEKLQYGRETEKSSWLTWKTRFSRFSWLLDWLPHSWKITGKPIYKQMTYPDTEWKAKEADDAGVRNVLKNRRRQRVTFSDTQNHSAGREEADDFVANTESVAIDLAEDEDDSEDWEDEVDESEVESSDDDVIGNFRKMRSECLEDRPLAGTLYIQRPDGKLVFNFNHNIR